MSTIFEPSSIFDFDPAPLPTPPPSHEQSKPTSTLADDLDMADVEFNPDDFLNFPSQSDRHSPPASSLPRPSRPEKEVLRMPESPPPDVDEEPEGWEEEMMLMREAEEEEALSRVKARLNAPARQPDGTVSNKQADAGREGFGDAELFDFEQPVASSSRAPLTPPPEAPPLARSAYERPCTLPPLRAETASGDFITFKRRYKPSPRPLRGEVDGARDTAPNLLGQSLHRLLREVQELKDEQKAIQLQSKFDSEHRRANLQNRAARVAGSSRVMWVDKYRPKQFADLLGEEKVHREVMSWLKEWDKCVFKRTFPGKKRKIGGDGGGSEFYADPLGRPRDRLLLLSGPPGLGKTTLAHILARQAGYKVLEINASDDRNAATVSTRIKNAIDAGSGITDAGRPTCVVVDEIDGATGGDQSFVKSLIKLIQDVPANRKRNTPAKPLRRPIICICNDLYATSLRPLRQHARVVRFRKPPSQVIVRRLREICERESLSADTRVLTSLADITGGDVRSCLNTLQFIRSKTSVVTEDHIRSTSVGSKDSLTSLQSTWRSLLVPLASKERRKLAASAVDDGRYIDRLIAQVNSCGDVDKLVQGCFEHYPTLKPLDASLSNVSRMLDGPVGFYDTLSKKIGEGEYEVMGYTAYAVVGWYTHMAAPANTARPIEWPKADYEAYLARTVNEEIAGQMKAGLPPILRSLFSPTTVLTELIPLLMRIITPPLKPVNANIVKSEEKALLARLVDLMIPLGLSFWSEKAENGQPMMRLEPPIDCFVHYDGKRADDVAAGRFAVRQLVAQAMDAELARRRGAADGSKQDTKETLVGMYGAVKKGQQLKPFDKAEGAATDFFGRAIVKPVPSALTSATNGISGDSHDSSSAAEMPPQPLAKRFRVVYKFHEGSSSAVRKSVKMSTLM